MMFKNWHEICKIGRQNQPLMVAILTVKEGSDIERRLLAAFPEVATDIYTWPIPLSQLMRESVKDNNEPSHNGIFPLTLKKHRIPYLDFQWKPENLPPVWATEHGEILPKEVADQCELGKTAKHGTVNWTVVYCNKYALPHDGWITLAIGDCVAGDL